MLKKLTKTALISGVSALALGLATAAGDVAAFDNPIDQATGSLMATGDTLGAIRVVSGDNETWTKIKPGLGFIEFPVILNAKSNPGGHTLNRVRVVQGNPIDVHNHAIFDSGTIAPDTQHSHEGTLTGSWLHLSAGEREEIIAACNAGLNKFSQEQPQFETETQVPLSLVIQSVTPDPGFWSEGLDWHEDTLTTNFPVKVICEPFTRAEPLLPADESAELPAAEITQVELGLSTGGAGVVGGPLVYTGSCPMGLNLDMRWVTNIGATLKTYVEHKDVSGQHNWTSTEFQVTTNQPAYGGHWKKEMTDFMSIPMAGAVAANGPGGANGHGISDGSLMFNPGGGADGFNPATSLGSSNTGNDTGMQQYVGFFRLVAYKNKVTMPALNYDGSVANTVIYNGKKMSGWRKYVVNCETEQSTVALDSPGGIQTAPPTGPFNPDDGNAFPLPLPPVDTTFDPATRDLTTPPTHAPKPSDTIIRTNADDERKRAAERERNRKLQAEKRRKALIAAKKAAERKRIRDAAIKARKMKLKAEAVRRAAAKKAARQRAIAARLKKQQAAAATAQRRKAKRSFKRTSARSAKSFTGTTRTRMIRRR